MASTLRDRIERIIAESGLNASALSLKAGLARGHLQTVTSGKTTSMTAITAGKLAAVTNFATAWILTGEDPVYAGATPTGTPRPPASRPKVVRTDIEYDDRYTHRREAVMLVRHEVPGPVIDSVNSIDLKSDEDPSIEEWLKIIEDRYRLYRRASEGLKRIDSVPLDD
jgi:hypothetical protein